LEDKSSNTKDEEAWNQLIDPQGPEIELKKICCFPEYQVL
jgi:hypothetical protein